ncbi:MAG: ribonuclease HII [Ignavibacteria bacterium RIFCSPLOWO2_02_FULL_55_14]|nr:MAG: ribonuclease HII [Ignavibacteria bacterium GWC2_56_12]OGU63693.1 MAG: ribonuclease HII [Ignavibacteria bacterium RIFCSPHIGHO2_02_FULL_56_12]OGU73715.1 MAG: ribonuclease HII [Ignavibacteria bacterium RIFCSPLOWO2_02_FULL_55_14]
MKRHLTTAGTDLERSYRERGLSIIAGVDEAGRGPLAGPVVAAAVVFGSDIVIEGVDDSKKLSPERREILAAAIRSTALAVGVGIVSHEEIDRMNILRATFHAMEIAVRSLKVHPDMLLIDGNAYRDTTFPYVTIVDGDALSHSIAAASIIAKVERDTIMKEFDAIYPEYGFAAHKGYGTERHREAIRKHGFCPIHRRSFKVHFPTLP